MLFLFYVQLLHVILICLTRHICYLNAVIVLIAASVKYNPFSQTTSSDQETELTENVLIC